MSNIWKTYPRQNIPEDLLSLVNGDTLLARLLINRKVIDARYFTNLSGLSETDPLEIPEMDKAFARVKHAIDHHEKILIYGDYDVDGTSSVALLYRAFALLGTKVSYYIPSRHSEGYGLNKAAVYKIRDQGAALMITCDCGISNQAEVAYANSLGLDVIVTDHHCLPEITPPSIANCNPKTLAIDHPLHYLPGVGVAYKLASLLLDHYLPRLSKALKLSLLDLVALGMVADMAELKAENRLLTVRGLEVLARTEKAGLRELLKLAGVFKTDANADHIGFGIAPRINAAGRLADATRAVELMITDDAVRALELATALDHENRERQLLCQQHTEEAFDLIASTLDLNTDCCIPIAKADWHHGVIGIVASRIVDKFHLPVFIMAIEGDKARGSVRSINVDNLDVFDEMSNIQARYNIFDKFGGHKMAAGFSLQASRVPELINILREHFKERLSEQNLAKTMKIDSALLLSELGFEFIERLERLAPFGIGNATPLFVSGPLKIRSWRSIGKDGKHLKIYLSQETTIGTIKIPTNNKTYEALLWNRAEEFLSYVASGQEEMAAVFTVRVSEYQGERSLQLEIKDWKAVADVDTEIFARFTTLVAGSAKT